MYKFLLCVRYLKTRYIALACIVSVMLGVATMIVVNSVMAGFGNEMRDRIKGILADVVVESNSLDGVEDADYHMQLIRDAAADDIEAMTATVEVYGMLSFEYAGQWITRPITLIGIDPIGKSKVGPLVDYLVNTDAFPTVDGEIDGWALNSAARTHRERWKRHREWMQQQFRADATLQGVPQNTASDSQIVDSSPSNAVPPFADTPPFADAAVSSSPQADSQTQAIAENDPFADDPFAGTGPAVATADASQPLEGRLYLGVGLVSFPYEDGQTGEVKTNMMVQPGDDVRISTVTAGRPPAPAHFYATVVDVFKSGMSEYDSSLVFCNLEHLQKVRGMIDPTKQSKAIPAKQIKLKD